MGSSFESSSMQTTFFARFASSAVSTPMPAPISITPLSESMPLSSAILGQTAGLTMKFCPSALEK